MAKFFPPFLFAIPNIIPIFAVLNYIIYYQMQDERLAFTSCRHFLCPQITYQFRILASVYPRVERQCAHSIW